MLHSRQGLENGIGFLLSHSMVLALALSIVGISSCVNKEALLAPQEPLVPTLGNSKVPVASDQKGAAPSLEHTQKNQNSAEINSGNALAISGQSQLFELVPRVAYESKLIQGATPTKPLELKLTTHKRNKGRIRKSSG